MMWEKNRNKNYENRIHLLRKMALRVVYNFESLINKKYFYGFVIIREISKL